MRILIVEDNDKFGPKLLGALADHYGANQVQLVSNLNEATDDLTDKIPDLIILDAKFPLGSVTRPEFLADKFLEKLGECLSNVRLKGVVQDDPAIILISSQDETADKFKDVIKWLNDGKIVGVLPKSATNVGFNFFFTILKHMVKENLVKRMSRFPLRQVDNLFQSFEGKIYTASETMREIGRQIGDLSNSDASVLITGKTGTGKGLIARAIHELSHRKLVTEGKFIAVNCAALSNELFETEIFGHAEGSFTGAVRDRGGLIKSADKGTLFLDEIATLSLTGQAKLLLALEDKEVRRVGDDFSTKVDFRLIAATNADLASLVKAGTFREDLYYRINILRIHIPPLSERREDIEVLMRQFLQRFCEGSGKRITVADFTPEARSFLIQCEWPGNVRQLENLIRRIVTIYRGEPISLEYLKKVASDLLPTEVNERVKNNMVDLAGDPLIQKVVSLDGPSDNVGRSGGKEWPSSGSERKADALLNDLGKSRFKGLLVRAKKPRWEDMIRESVRLSRAICYVALNEQIDIKTYMKLNEIGDATATGDLLSLAEHGLFERPDPKRHIYFRDKDMITKWV